MIRTSQELLAEAKNFPLMQTRTPDGCHYELTDGRAVDSRVAELAIKGGDLLAAEDGLFPGCSQTFVLDGPNE